MLMFVSEKYGVFTDAMNIIANAVILITSVTSSLISKNSRLCQTMNMTNR